MCYLSLREISINRIPISIGELLIQIFMGFITPSQFIDSEEDKSLLF